MADRVKSAAASVAAPSDTELVRRALARDAAAFRAIMKTHNQRLYRLARGIVPVRPSADGISFATASSRSH